ncbi:MAG: ligase-associated DNA damage response DEXH box helicase [Alphaproteobacteria bacterium]|nr:ligase-associated DNA damage response DEXH box helicase [Alphaproteobacteria bacterium]
MEARLPATMLPPVFARWFESRGWRPRAHQMAMIEAAERGASVLLTAPTGGGKTLAGFLPSLIELAARPALKKRPAPAIARTGDRLESWKPAPRPGSPLHTLYISPLKALAVDVARNLGDPVKEMGLPIAIETRTGDTPVHRRQRQKMAPPEMLLTTPEQLALLLASREAEEMFSGLKTVVLDELHALVTSKRGDLLALDLARLTALAPGLRRVGLSATVADPDSLRRYLMPQTAGKETLSELIVGAKGADPALTILASQERVPWAGHSARHAYGEIYAAIAQAKTALVFVNTRSQAEIIFRSLWHLNELNLPIALHHGSLDVAQRRKVEAAMAAGRLRAVVATSTLDLGIDWGDVDLVIQVGAPKGCSRLHQRIGRANHRLDEPSRALLVPANRFEVMECVAARDAVSEGVLDGETNRKGARDVLAQHVLGVASAGPFHPDDLYTEIKSAAPYAHYTRETFDRVVDFVATGGYALRTYERFARLRKMPDGRLRVASPHVAQRYRLNVGTIVEAPLLKVRLVRSMDTRRAGVGGRILGQIEEYFIEQLAPGDTFLFSGKTLRFEAMQEAEVVVTPAGDEPPMVPSFQGGKFPLSTYLADRVRRMVADEGSWRRFPPDVAEWLRIQAWRSRIPEPDQLLVETFPRAKKSYLVCYPFDGRLAHQSLGMLVTRRLERMRMRPLGFVASEYALAVWALGDLAKIDMAALFDEDMLGDDLDAWLAESNLLKRTFRNCAVIAGLIERRFPGQEKSGRQVNFSSDLIYDVLRQHEPNHILLEAANEDAATGLLDIARLGALLRRVKGRIVTVNLPRVSPLAVPVMLEIGKEPIYGEANEEILAEAADGLISEAMA